MCRVLAFLGQETPLEMLLLNPDNRSEERRVGKECLL